VTYSVIISVTLPDPNTLCQTNFETNFTKSLDQFGGSVSSRNIPFPMSELKQTWRHSSPFISRTGS